jgi:protein arginine kinase
MRKWYEKGDSTSPKVIISSRIRLARNLNAYPFPNRLNDALGKKVIESIAHLFSEKKEALILNDNLVLSFKDMEKCPSIEKVAMMEKHMISPLFLNATTANALIVSEDESISIMINEEDHLRVQTMTAGADLLTTYEQAMKIDDFIENHLDYAYHKIFGYLTACPTNVGTGLRASYMMHVPALEATGQLPIILEAIGKFGITCRGIYGESTEPIGSVFQVSNQVSLGFSEQEIIDNLNSVAMQIVDQELLVREKLLSERRMEFEDSIYRSYGILSQARILTSKEAMTLLSDVKLGFELGILKTDHQEDMNIFNLMTSIQPANLQKIVNKALDVDQRDIARATLIRQTLPTI